MSFRKPIFVGDDGRRRAITAPDSIDPSILPAPSSSATLPQDVPAGTTFTIAAGTQQVAYGPITVEGVLQVNGRLRIL